MNNGIASARVSLHYTYWNGWFLPIEMERTKRNRTITDATRTPCTTVTTSSQILGEQINLQLKILHSTNGNRNGKNLSTLLWNCVVCKCALQLMSTLLPVGGFMFNRQRENGVNWSNERRTIAYIDHTMYLLNKWGLCVCMSVRMCVWQIFLYSIFSIICASTIYTLNVS